MSKRRIQIRDLQKQEIEEQQERRLLIRLQRLQAKTLSVEWMNKKEGVDSERLRDGWIPEHELGSGIWNMRIFG